MWTVKITAKDGTETTASAVTKADARAWARQFIGPGERFTITRPVSVPVTDQPQLFRDDTVAPDQP